jgi:ABC-type multidrug transport system fused ATPase/permease subunit
MLVAAQVASNPIVSLFVAVVLFGLGRMVIQRVAFAEGNPWLVRIMTVGLLLHLLAAPAQIFVVNHFYHGISDWIRYTHQGSILGPNFRRFDFTTAGANVRQIINDGSVSIAAGIVMAIVGVNELATFLVFSWLAFIGAVFFYRAFSLTFRGANDRRYALMLFLLPSLIFWTADVSKEAIMMFALGLTAYGAAKILARRPGGFVLVVPGVAIGVLIRPNELLLILAGFAVAMMVPTAAVRKNMGGIRRLFSLVLVAVLLAGAVYLTLRYLRGAGNGTSSLSQTNSNNQGAGLGFGSSGVPYSPNVATYPRDVYEVLFNPLLYNAHGSGELVAALENSAVFVLVLLSLRNLRMVLRAAFARPYVMLCLTYSLTFMYAFAALGNLGLIERERVMMFPFLLVLLCIPRTPKGRPAGFEWELRRRARLQLRQAIEQRNARRKLLRSPTT